MSVIPSKQYNKLKERHPKFMEALEELGKAAKQAGPIDEKTAQLIQLAAATANRSEGAVHSHTRRALEAGASSEEIYQAILLLTSTVGFPNVTAALSWAGDVIEG
ncbi:MAG: carboxymuconolactone decarboxylase family protein [Thermodesulfobacteriota bacterium]